MKCGETYKISKLERSGLWHSPEQTHCYAA